MMLYIRNPRDTTGKLLKLINKLGKVARYKINVQKSVAFLYTNNETSERKIKENKPIYHHIKQTTGLGNASFHSNPIERQRQ